MAVDEAARHQLYNDLVDAVGPESTGTIMELLPPVGWADVATRQDLDALGHRIETQIADLRADLRTEIATLGRNLRREMAAGQRQLFFGMWGSMLTLAGLVWAIVTFLA